MSFATLDDIVGLSVSRSLLSQSSSAWEACSWGCNPHCHFILLLRSLSFDHTVLLDFLISAETCFLEYCVLYLKLLRDNWQDFCASCCCIEDSERVTSARSPPEASLVGASGTADPQIPSRSRSPETDSSVCSLSRLVDYGSSEGSEEEDAGEASADTSRGKVVVGSVETVRTGCTGPLAGKVLLCLTELRTVITRLHSRGLFPYNPTSLLKLIMAIEAKRDSESPASEPAPV